MGPHNFQKILFDLLTFNPDQGNAGIREANQNVRIKYKANLLTLS